MGDVRSIRPDSAEPVVDDTLSAGQRHLLAILDETARRVREGKIDALALAYVWPDEGVSTRWRCNSRGSALLGAVGRLAYDINRESWEETAGPVLA